MKYDFMQIPTELAVKSHLIHYRKPLYSLFHNMWKTSSTICGESLPQYVEEKFHSMWKSELCGALQLI